MLIFVAATVDVKIACPASLLPSVASPMLMVLIAFEFPIVQ
jgi:hypothetical protein